jgi:WD40 repeat protein
MQIDIVKRRQLTGHRGAVYKILAQPDALFSAGGDGWLVRWPLDNIETGTVVAQAEAQFFSFAVSGHWLIAGDMDGGVHWLNPQNTDLNHHIAAHRKGCYGILPLGDYVFTVGAEGRLIQWSADNGQRIETLQMNFEGLRCLAKCPTKPELAIGGRDRMIHFVDPETMLVLGHVNDAHKTTVFSLAYHPKAELMYSGGKDAMLQVFEYDEFVYMSAWSQPAHLYTVNDIQVSPDGRLVATASRDKTIKLWDARNMKLLKVIDFVRAGGHRHSVNTLCWINNNRLASGSDDKTIIVWDVVYEDQNVS